MSDVPNQMSGRCLCGAVTYTIDAEPAIQAVCHCSDCQRQSGSPYSVVVGVPREAVTLEGDSLATHTTQSGDGGDTVRNFCSACGSPIFSAPSAMPDLIFIKAGTLDDSSWLEPNIEIWRSSAQPWTPDFEGTAQMDRSPASA